MKNYHKANMFLFLAFGLIFMAGFSEAEFDCNLSVFDNCGTDDTLLTLAETEEEFHAKCNPIIEFLRCARNVSEFCEGHTNALKELTEIISIVQDVCNEDHLLHSAIVDNLQCIAKLKKDNPDLCPAQERKQSKVLETYVSENGITQLGKEEYDSLLCEVHIYMYGCLTAAVSEECGDIARGAVLEIFQRLLGVSGNCNDEIVEDFSSIVNLYEAVEEELTEENIIRKK